MFLKWESKYKGWGRFKNGWATITLTSYDGNIGKAFAV